MRIDNNTFVVLWSPHQDAFHVETVTEMLSKNMDIFTRGDKGDFIVLDFALSREDAHEKVRALMDVRDQRSSYLYAYSDRRPSYTSPDS